MEVKYIIRYIIIAAVIFISITALMKLSTVSENIRKSRQSIDSVMTELKATRKIVENQTKTIEQLRVLNAGLYRKVQETDSVNKLIKSNIDAKFSQTNKNLKDIKEEIENIMVPEIH